MDADIRPTFAQVLSDLAKYTGRTFEDGSDSEESSNEIPVTSGGYAYAGSELQQEKNFYSASPNINTAEGGYAKGVATTNDSHLPPAQTVYSTSPNLQKPQSNYVYSEPK